MNRRDEILREILSDEKLMEKYGISEKNISEMTANAPYSKKIVEILSVIINENANGRTARQIYPTLKNIHKI